MTCFVLQWFKIMKPFSLPFPTNSHHQTPWATLGSNPNTKAQDNRGRQAHSTQYRPLHTRWGNSRAERPPFHTPFHSSKDWALGVADLPSPHTSAGVWLRAHFPTDFWCDTSGICARKGTKKPAQRLGLCRPDCPRKTHHQRPFSISEIKVFS